MTLEVLNNMAQAVIFDGLALFSALLAFRRLDRRLMILALGYACFSMGTLFWTLHLAITGQVPQVFYVSEVSWLASYLFFLSYQIVRSEGIRFRFSGLSALAALFFAVSVLVFRIFGPSYLMSSLLALTFAVNAYLSVFRRVRRMNGRRTDCCMLLILFLQILLYAVSIWVHDYTRFNVYFAVDMLLTASLAALLPLCVREGKTT